MSAVHSRSGKAPVVLLPNRCFTFNNRRAVDAKKLREPLVERLTVQMSRRYGLTLMQLWYLLPVNRFQLFTKVAASRVISPRFFPKGFTVTRRRANEIVTC